ncbi:DUF2254 domain-containing protein [Sphingomicrobium astaxanthinifaciens]|uniref:DUF2254 domain-containing protein n=1 Tax=Sphingomicrobium astaxanthinifaciens TaxID=1227949 RepID=UPI001FCA6B9F|nr:DUF2254 domain-containing protein [Sphingomicrobium astaxanthinifaciens]MCJ7421546.1 DUF2254 domain-containing protein [Sphingomicrobium astaxanthinifaciens]
MKFTVDRLRQMLWVKPLGYALIATAVVFLGQVADNLALQEIVPNISPGTIEKLLTVISASMLGVATFAVASMVAAYASAGGNATPRAFSLIIADGMSQTALSSFVGAFIFSIVGLIALSVGYFGIAGRFTLFVFTLITFAWVIVTFVRWVDNIARLGRLGDTITKVEHATRKAFAQWPAHAPLGAAAVGPRTGGGIDVFAEKCAFIQHIDIDCLEKWANDNEAEVLVFSHPGALVDPARPLAKVFSDNAERGFDFDKVRDAFVLGDARSYSSDPRFGLIALSEIASRALSPGINDPGTAIDVTVRMAKIIRDWDTQDWIGNPYEPRKRVIVRALEAADIIEDAFGAISKDGVDSVEFGVWLQKSLSLLTIGTSQKLSCAAQQQAFLSLERARKKLDFAPDFKRIEKAYGDKLEPYPPI